MPRTHGSWRRMRSRTAALAAVVGVLLVAGCTADPGPQGAATPSVLPTAPADAGGASGTPAPDPTVTRAPGPPTEAELATCSTLAQVLPDSTKLVQALGDGNPVDPTILDRVKQGDASLAGMAPENMKPLVSAFSTIVDELDALRTGADTDGASLDTGQYLRATSAFLDYCLDDVGYVPPTASPTPAP
ncbi:MULTISPECIES: hypothetical protein [Clavibacter]|uniref:Lipoprotein n=1 Tax=Clavibacter tessellarius TaxID=31965 RepID=A0A154V247_9MICO|nr:hypothetical protein [Clavibacter michiganensis]KZC95349.1 hypothetical protein AWH51_08635 [Clavibacter michiganensis subsp. tessellarius]